MSARIRTLAILERLKRHEMAHEMRELAALRAQIASLERTRATLLERLQTEARIITLETAPYVGSYIRSVRNEAAQIDRTLSKTTPKVEALETVMIELFREVETIKLARTRAAQTAREDRARREASEADSLTLMRWPKDSVRYSH
ncbi:MAG: flagellar export protein FliJ [Roseinatronobacter sp.]